MDTLDKAIFNRESAKNMKLNYKKFKSAIRLRETSDVFSVFKGYWKNENLKNRKEAKAIFINAKDMAFGICDVPADKKNIPIDKKDDLKWQIKAVFDQARKAKAKAVIIAESRLPEDIFADNDRVKLFKDFSSTASSYDLKLDDLISMGSSIYTSMSLQGLSKKKKQAK